MNYEEQIKKLEGDLSLAQAELHHEKETYTGESGVYHHFRDMLCNLILKNKQVKNALNLTAQESMTEIWIRDLEYSVDELESKVEDLGYITDDFDQDTLTENITNNVVSSTEFKDEVSEIIRKHLNNLEVTLTNHN